ncbi:ABC transporter permease [Paenibacillus mucilaginosus]|uniref:Binding-protein-dependent transport systems inner membrane component n=3 Tax=Paenibacillus mucilaginosus TaxID=61624 RepID=H6ND25_9BACL|nr:ABC transporter permease [Paenibacillus mucilaginosus]AEI41448.1 binding-protein-dependent transport systems inner membrane component [Paenibacillus mucilaginosus KNP414]AFC29986.1 binding-protein-dependent transport systems inner membrane component [Paenibacillus mucilaginosus 3016]AFH62173.1 sulfonate ABC transporter permease [Paenibacillus mucilaginosus K02]MCG7217577.1 ABC transporter permease [Paenibacillus mucilaginosus]WDM30459.1 ABC transporter permease [Paenibacillus mucilaginosus]
MAELKGTPAEEGRQQPAELADEVYTAFRRSERRLALSVRLTQLALLVLFFGLWETAAAFKWIDGLLFSSPSRIVQLLYEKLLDGSLLEHTWVTVWETVVGFVLGTLLGTAGAALIWFSPFLSRVLDPYIVVLNSLPKVALGPLFIVALGPGVLSIIATTLSLTVIITILVIYNAFREVDPNLVKVVRIFGGSTGTVFRKVILPASYPAIISTLKVNVGLAWVGVIVGEFLVSKAGLGYLIIYGFQVFNFTLVIGALFVIAAAAALMYQLVASVESRLIGRSR